MRTNWKIKFEETEKQVKKLQDELNKSIKAFQMLLMGAHPGQIIRDYYELFQHKTKGQPKPIKNPEKEKSYLG